jgi:hypothetical protein
MSEIIGQRKERHEVTMTFSIDVYPNQLHPTLPDLCVFHTKSKDIEWLDAITFDRDFDDDPNEEGVFYNSYARIYGVASFAKSEQKK